MIMIIKDIVTGPPSIFLFAGMHLFSLLHFHI